MFKENRHFVVASLLCLFAAVPRSPAAPLTSSPALAKPPAATPLRSSLFDKPELDPSLAADTRLDRKVTLDEIGTPLETLLAKMSNASLPLTCETACADNKLQVRVNSRSLRSVMAAIAQMTPGTWQVEGNGKIKGYRLVADPKAADYENDWWKLYAQERGRALAEVRTLVLARMQEKYIVGDADSVSPDGTPFVAIPALARSQEFWNLLPEPLQKQIAGQLVDTLFYSADHNTVHRPVEGAIAVSFQSLSTQAQADILVDANLFNKEVKPENASTISFNNSGFSVVPCITTVDGQRHEVMIPLFTPSEAVAPTLSLNHKGLPEQVKKRGDQAPDLWKQLAKCQEGRVWINDPSQQKPDPFHLPRRSEVLSWLANTANLEIIADYYSVAGEPLSPADQRKRLTLPLKQELDYRAAQEDMSWQKHADGLYLFRDNRWYRDDRLEVPDKVLVPLLETLRRDADVEYPAPSAPIYTAPPGSLPKGIVITFRDPQRPPLAVPPAEAFATQLNLSDEIVSQLSPYQIANGLLNYVVERGSKAYDPKYSEGGPKPFEPVADAVLSDYDTYLFHSGLSSDQNNALLSGTLRASSLSPAQLQQAAFLLPDIQMAMQNQSPQPIMLGLCPDTAKDNYLTSHAPRTLDFQRIRFTVVPPAGGVVQQETSGSVSQP